jgi:hypothetical protein
MEVFLACLTGGGLLLSVIGLLRCLDLRQAAQPSPRQRQPGEPVTDWLYVQVTHPRLWLVVMVSGGLVFAGGLILTAWVSTR